MPEAVIISTARSAIGRAGRGSLTGMRADDMAAQMVGAALDAVPGLAIADVDELYLGVAHQVGEQAQNIARRVSVLLGHDALPAATISKACASSLQAIAIATASVRAGLGDLYVAAGVESVSRYSKMAGDDDRHPALRPAPAPTAERWTDPREAQQMPDFYLGMGLTAENVATLCGVDRTAQDAFALRSQQRYARALAAGFWADEIHPLALPDGSTLATDESARPATRLDGLAALEPVFLDGGTVTAGNSCPLNDGASAVVIASDSYAKAHGITPLGRVVAFGSSGLSPEIMGLGPVDACRRALDRASLTVADVGAIEINEAFAAQVIASCRGLGIDPEQVNRRGGAIALGHPFGMTGARILTTLLHQLSVDDATFGLEAMCVGGGMGMAAVVERLS